MADINPKKLKDMFAALNNANRIKIVMLCSETGLTITELSKKLKLNYSVTSEYVSMLEKAGLVRKTRNDDKTVRIKSLIRLADNGEIKKTG